MEYGPVRWLQAEAGRSGDGGNRGRAGQPMTSTSSGDAAEPESKRGPTGRRTRTVLVVGAIVAAVALVAVVVTVLVVGDDDPSVNEVFRQPAGAAGTDPFTGSVSATGQDSGLPPQPTESSSSGDDLEVSTTPGSEPGLYGGTQDQATCDREQLISFLEDDPAKADAWASVEGIEVDEIPSFIRDLTPTRLRFDTRVTNHGYRDGQATSFQSVLQAGTAVLVDDQGVPRVRCACGNPLLAPQAVTGAMYRGPTWSGFSDQSLQVVVSVQTVTQFVLVDVDTGDQFTRPVGSDGSDDTGSGGDGLDGTYTVTLDLTCGSELGSEGTSGSSATVDWVFAGENATIALPETVPIAEFAFDAPVNLNGNEFQISVVQGDGSRIDLAGTVTDDGAEFEGSGAAGQGTAASTCIVDFSGQRTSAQPSGSAQTTSTTATTLTSTTAPAVSTVGPPCTDDAVLQALSAGSVLAPLGGSAGNSAEYCDGPWAVVGVQGDGQNSGVVLMAEGDGWKQDFTNACSPTGGAPESVCSLAGIY